MLWSKIKFEDLPTVTLRSALSTPRWRLEASSTDFGSGGTFRVNVHTLLDMDPRTPGQAETSATMSATVSATGPVTVTVVIADSELLDQVLSITAVVGIEPVVLGDVGLLRQHWASAATVLLDTNQGARAVSLGLQRRTHVYVISDDKTSQQAQQLSMELGAAVVALPSSASWLSDTLSTVVSAGRGTGRLVCVVGGSGGVGASTLAAGLAFVAARVRPTMLIDADPLSGGLDLLLGAERTPGWRWPRLANARGHLGDLSGQLPSVDGIELLSMARCESPPGWTPNAEQLEAVLLSAMRSHDLTVVDLSRTLGAWSEAALRRADLGVLLVRDDIGGVAAGREIGRQLEAQSECFGLIVRQGRSRLLQPKLVASGVGLQLLGSLVEDPTLALAAERGDPPGRSGRSSLSRLCRQLLDHLQLADTADDELLASG